MSRSRRQRWAGTLLIVAGTVLVGLGRPAYEGRTVKSWILLTAIVGSTVVADLLQSMEMKRHGEIQDFHPRGWVRLAATLARKKFLILAIAFMAVSFFAFMTLLEGADLSFAVPGFGGNARI